MCQETSVRFPRRLCAQFVAVVCVLWLIPSSSSSFWSVPSDFISSVIKSTVCLQMTIFSCIAHHSTSRTRNEKKTWRQEQRKKICPEKLKITEKNADSRNPQTLCTLGLDVVCSCELNWEQCLWMWVRMSLKRQRGDQLCVCVCSRERFWSGENQDVTSLPPSETQKRSNYYYFYAYGIHHTYEDYGRLPLLWFTLK